ncbi:hypothetical protein B0T25DRAFT_109933 [Lasiosphaeria hispida]|uniref:Uncharacterized protein n=1 Tax=Lasiosphaeria hispida TaxID=260671 RepID=A0AAJ0MI45_9PEZI|nr:hypothetical protein B0T25DRAFT_109933 [Lasiosphaeria hispida]
MSDHHWLRGLRTSRAQQPSFGPGSGSSQPPPANDAPSDTATRTSIHDPLASQQNPHGSPTRHRAVHRVSSLLNLNFGLGAATNSSGEQRWTASTSTTSPPPPPPEPSPRHRYRDSFDPERDLEATWHNPNLLQMAESLQAVMIGRRDPLASIPIMYNSYVLRLIEGFADMTKKLREKDEKMAELSSLREKELDQFRGISEEWIQREKDYKAEIKRLELLLVKESKDGVASVTLARHNSLVNRSDTKRFQARLGRISNSQDEGPTNSVPALKWELESTDLTRAGSYYRITEPRPQMVDPSKDVLMSRLVEKDQGLLATAVPVETLTVRQTRILDGVSQAEQENQSQQSFDDLPENLLTQRDQAHSGTPTIVPAIISFPVARQGALIDKSRESQVPFKSSRDLSNHGSTKSPRVGSGGSPPPAEKPLKHRYSFIEGDDELVLTIPIVSASQAPQTNPKQPKSVSSRSESRLTSIQPGTYGNDEASGSTTAFRKGDGLHSYVPVGASSNSLHGTTSGPDLDPLSTSVSSVIWRGADDRKLLIADGSQESASSSASSGTEILRDPEGGTTGEEATTQHPSTALLTPSPMKTTEAADFKNGAILISNGKFSTPTVPVSAVDKKPKEETPAPSGVDAAPRLLSSNKPKSPKKSKAVTPLGTDDLPDVVGGAARIVVARAVSRADKPYGGSGPSDE